ncbi:MAG: Lsm family RNA-binding protein [Candidatus Jordarchaeales archaeon]|nr:Lsm family RNA-binding protein [Candidatus Jordarchaeia archaeon]
MSGVASSSFFKDLNAIINKKIKVNLEGGRTYEGTLKSYEAGTLSLCLTDAEDDRGNTYSRVFIRGDKIVDFFQIEEGINLRELYMEISKVFPHGDVEFLEENNVILVLKKVKVTENGVEGEGPIARRVKEIYDRFMAERGASTS